MFHRYCVRHSEPRDTSAAASKPQSHGNSNKGASAAAAAEDRPTIPNGDLKHTASDNKPQVVCIGFFRTFLAQ